VCRWALGARCKRSNLAGSLRAPTPLVSGSCTVNGSGLVSEARFGPRLYHWAMLWSLWIMTAPTRLDDPAYEETIR
jgi:hypothetical protein